MNLAEIIAKIDQLKSEIEAVRPLAPEQQARMMQKFRLDWNYHSNAIEGNTLTLGETRAFLLHGLTAKGKPFKDYLDIKGHNEAIAYLEAFIQGQNPLTEAVIRKLHKILLVEPYEVEAMTPEGQPTRRRVAIGQYKTMPNHVRTSTGEIYYYATPEETPAQMGDLMQWYRAETAKGELHPLILAATFHYRFVVIHPFDDGNGRMARLLTNLILMQAGYVPVIIRIQSKPEYLLALEEADAGDLEDFVSFIGTALIHSMELYLRGARGESVEELEDLDKKIALLQQQLESETQAKKIDKQNFVQKKLNSFDNFVSPFLRDLFSSLEKFEPLFKHSEYSLSYNEDYPQSKASSNKLSHLLQDLLKIRKQNTDITQIQLSYEFIRLISHNNFNLIFYLQLDFQENETVIHYAIEVVIIPPQRRPLAPIYNHHYSLKYNSTYDMETINDLILQISNQIYSHIEKQANRPTLK